MKRYNIVPVKNTVAQDHGIITAEIKMAERSNGAWVQYEDVEAEIVRLESHRDAARNLNEEQQQYIEKLEAVLEAAKWIYNDAKYQAPEQTCVATVQVWMSKLSQAIVAAQEGEVCETCDIVHDPDFFRRDDNA